MKRILLACTLAALCVGAGCNLISNTNKQNDNKATASATASPTATASPKASASPSATPAGKPKDSPDIGGSYFPVGTLTSDFSEIELLHIAYLDDVGDAAPLNGFLRPRRQQAKDYKISNPKLEGNNLTFTTASVNGISYKFTGKFVTMDNFAENPPPFDRVILKGALEKSQDGTVVAETDISFTYSAGG